MKLCFVLLIVAALSSCKSEPTSGEENNKSTDTTHFFQITQFIQSQINEVNQTPYFIYKLEVLGDKKDSSAIDNKVFNNLSKQFLQTDISDPSNKKFYKENVFFDETIKTFTINYTTANKDLEIQNVDVLLDQDGKTVKRIFIRKFKDYTDSSAMELLSWKTNESFEINRLVQLNNKSEISRRTTVVWNDKGE